MPLADEYRSELIPLLPTGAFLRIDRGKALFVSDAPRMGECPVEIRGFICKIRDKLMFITPKYENLPEGVRPIYTDIIKADADKQDRLIRQNLAIALRKGDKDAAAFLNKLLYDENERKSEEI